MYKNCIVCNSSMSSSTKICPVCGFLQGIEIPVKRTGQCRCQSGKMLLATISHNDGHSDNFCIDCITPQAASVMSTMILEANTHLPNQDIRDKILALAKLNGKYRFSEKDKKDALVAVIGMIHAANERRLNNWSSTE